VTLEAKMRQAPADALDLVQRLVVFNPGERLTAEECLQHPYVAQFHAPQRETAAQGRVRMALNDSDRYSTRKYRNQLYREAGIPVTESKKRKARLSHTTH
jgi:mitogen-activated protein kinase 15